jgi:hypothetical protein
MRNPLVLILKDSNSVDSEEMIILSKQAFPLETEEFINMYQTLLKRRNFFKRFVVDLQECLSFHLFHNSLFPEMNKVVIFCPLYKTFL